MTARTTGGRPAGRPLRRRFHPVSLLYSFLVWSAFARRRPTGQRIWDLVWARAVARFHGAVSSRMYGFPVVVNFGYLSPVYSRQYDTYNMPLVDIVAAVSARLGRPATFVDVGAGVGDTVLLVRRNCPDALGPVLALDGDDEFFGYLEQNLRQVPASHCRQVMLAAGAGGASSPRPDPLRHRQLPGLHRDVRGHLGRGARAVGPAGRRPQGGHGRLRRRGAGGGDRPSGARAGRHLRVAPPPVSADRQGTARGRSRNWRRPATAT